MPKLRPWYSRVGPLSWYRSIGRTEWIRLSLSVGGQHLVGIHWSRQARLLAVWILGTVHRRSRYGAPAAVEPRWSFERSSPARL